MKKKVILVAVLAVAVLVGTAAFFGAKTEPTFQADTNVTVPVTEFVAETVHETIPAPAGPEWETGISRASYGGAIYTYLELGMEVDAIGVFKDYYVIAGEECDLLVEKRFVRLEDEEPFESWEGYAKQGAKVFESVYLVDSTGDKTTDESIAELTENTQVAVLEGKGDWLYIKWGEGEGYVHVDRISGWRITYDGGSDCVDGTDVSADSLAATDFQAGVVLLGDYYGPEMEEDEEFKAGKGVVIARGIEAYIYLLSRDDEARVIGYDEEFCTIYLEDGLTAKLPRWLLRLEGDAEYESWTGCARGNAVVYGEHQMRSERKSLTVNTEVLVLDKLPECYVVMVDDEIGYMELDAVSETEFVTYGGGASTGDVWTPPAL